jgi:hypothetical protein
MNIDLSDIQASHAASALLHAWHVFELAAGALHSNGRTLLASDFDAVTGVNLSLIELRSHGSGFLVSDDLCDRFSHLQASLSFDAARANRDPAHLIDFDFDFFLAHCS